MTKQREHLKLSGRLAMNAIFAAMVLNASAEISTKSISGPGTTAPSPAPVPRRNLAADRLFGLTNLWTFHLRFEPAAWAAIESTTLQPLFQTPEIDSWEYRARKGPPATPASEANKSNEDRVFEYVHATLQWEGQVLNDVGIRYKGNSTYWNARDSLKRSFKIDFNRYVRGQKFRGLKKLNLHNNALDPSQARQALAADVFRRAGIPAPRTAFARVYLTVPGQMDDQYLGLYTVVEQVDDQFIEESFGDKTGLLMKPEYTRGLTYLGEDWPPYIPMFCPEHKAALAHARRVVDWVRLIDCAEDEVFQSQIGSFIEVPEFLRFLAVQSIIANLDSPLVHGKNYYLYLHPVSQRFVFIPWDLDLSFGLYPSAGSMAQQAALSIQHPYAGRYSWLDRLLAGPGMPSLLRRQYQDLLEGPLKLEQILANLEAIQKAIQPAIADENHPSTSPRNPLSSPATTTLSSTGSTNALSLGSFVVHRFESIRDQLAGKTAGYVPLVTEKGPPTHDRPGNVLAWQIMRLADRNRDAKVSEEEFTAMLRRWWTGWDANRSGKLSLKEVKIGLEMLLASGPEGSGGEVLARKLWWRNGVSVDYEFPAPEFLRAGASWFESWDKDPSGCLNRPKLVQALDELLGSGL